MKKFVLFYNPVSGHAAFRKKLDWIIRSFQARNLVPIPYRTEKEGNDSFLSILRDVGADGIIAAGGDGTIHEIVNLIMRYSIDLPLGIIGCGTSNDFATYLGINRDMEHFFDIIAAGKTRAVDLGCIGDRYFINVASAGSLTSIAHEVNVRLKNTMGKMAYYLKGIEELPHIRSFPLHVVADGRSFDLDTFIFVVANSSVVGSMKHIADGMSVDDGKLDFLAVQKCGVSSIASLTIDLLTGKPISDKKYVTHIQAREFDISSAKQVQSDLDGEAGPMLPLHIQAAAHAISVFA